MAWLAKQRATCESCRLPKIPRDLESRIPRPISDQAPRLSRNIIPTPPTQSLSQSQSFQFHTGNAPSSANHIVVGVTIPPLTSEHLPLACQYPLKTNTQRTRRLQLLSPADTRSIQSSTDGNNSDTMASIARQSLLAPARCFAARGVAARPMMGVAGFHASSRRCDILPAGPRT